MHVQDTLIDDFCGFMIVQQSLLWSHTTFLKTVEFLIVIYTNNKWNNIMSNTWCQE